jgi:hypothetical protein
VRFTPATMLTEIEKNLHFVPDSERDELEPFLAAMRVGQVTPIPHAMRMRIQRAFVLHCVMS